MLFVFFFYCAGDPRDLHVLTHSFPTRRSSDRRLGGAGGRGNDVLQDAAAAAPVLVARAVHGLLRGGRGVHGGHQAALDAPLVVEHLRSEEHTSELQSLMRISYAVFCLKKKKNKEEYVTADIIKTQNIRN